MRLIDANKVEIGFDELCQSPYFKSDVNAKHGAETLMDLCVRSDSHKPNTIDPETLPIVQELRKQLTKVTAERDAAIKYLKIAADDNGRCYGCKWLNEATEACTHKLGMEACDSVSNNMWEWKGI